MEILARVHRRRVVHQDIKPSNVLVWEGRPTLLDFDVAWGGLYDEVHGGSHAGTPAYMAPEQVDRGVITSTTDLYALGTVLYEALSGRLPFDHSGAYQIMFARCLEDPIPLGRHNPDAPDEVLQLVDAMIQRDPARRPRDAREVLLRLEGRPSNLPGPAADPGVPWSVDELRAMIVGPDRIFHVPEDAAAVLWSRTRGDRTRVWEELESWVRVGFARRDGERVVLDRAAVDRLLQPESRVSPAEIGSEAYGMAWAHAATADTLRPGTPGRLGHLMRALPTGRSNGLGAVLDEAIAAARRSLSDGHTGRGLASLADAWLTAKRISERVPMEVLRELFVVWTELALVDGTPAAIDRALYEFTRANGLVIVADLEALLRAAVVIHRSPARAFEEASALPVFAEAAMERWRHAVRTQAARLGPLDGERTTVESLRAWASASQDPQDRAAFASWEAWTLYRRGLYADAADRHLASADLDRLPASRLSSTVAAASALLEGFLPERALGLATTAREVAAELRLTYLEARAAWIERAALYRLDRTPAPDFALVESVKAVGVGSLYALTAMTEAAVAWRSGDDHAAHDLSMAAFREWSAAGRRWAPDMARALALACGSAAQPGEVATLVDEALACTVPAAGLQVLALLALGGHSLSGLRDADVERLASLVPGDMWMRRAAILSTDEALDHLRGRAAVGQPKRDGGTNMKKPGIIGTHVGEVEEPVRAGAMQPDRGDVGAEWDVGVFEIYDGASVVGLLYVTNPNNDLTKAKDHWGLGPNYIWPSSTKIKTFKYQWSSTLTAAVASTTDFKTQCDNLFGSGNTQFIRSTNATF